MLPGFIQKIASGLAGEINRMQSLQQCDEALLDVFQKARGAQGKDR